MNTSSPETNGAGDAGIQEIAARWVVRQDRRLTPAEEGELAAWLAADPRHARALKQSAASWHRFRQIATAVRQAPAETAKPRSTLHWIGVGGLAAAAALVSAAIMRDSGAPRIPNETNVPAAGARVASSTQRFADGSFARVRSGAEVVAAYTPAERRVRLVRGEAFFSVTKDSARPFLVEVGNVTVRAVGTAFAVRSEPQTVDVLVTEGTVKVTPPASVPARPGDAAPADSSAMVEAGQRAVVVRTPQGESPRVVVTAVSSDAIAQALAWNESMLEFSGTPLSEVVAAFSQRTGRRIEIGDPTLGAVRLGGRFPTDDIDGFVRVLEEIYDVKAERQADSSLVLRRAR